MRPTFSAAQFFGYGRPLTGHTLFTPPRSLKAQMLDPSLHGSHHTAPPPPVSVPAAADTPRTQAADAPVLRVVYQSGQQHSAPHDGSLKYHARSLSMADVGGEHNLLRQYIQRHGREAVQHNIRRAHQSDRDGDGIIDRHDTEPDTWNVSNRDLRMFTTLAEESKSTLARIFAHDAAAATAVKYAPNKFAGQADVAELTGHWQLLKVHDDNGVGGSGLNYSIFGNGKTATGYQNIVVAFAPTASVADAVADAKLTLGARPIQAMQLEQTVMRDLAQLNPEKVYATGYSLGGYLAQYFAAHNMQQSPEWAAKFQRSTLFNPAILKTNALSAAALKNARALTDRFLDTEWQEHGHTVKKTASFVIRGEWVGNILGNYQQTTWFDSKDGTIKHGLFNFYGDNDALKQQFSQGYRSDRHYRLSDSDRDGISDSDEQHIGLNPHHNSHRHDSDGDGFSDALEIKLGSDWQDAASQINLADYYTVKQPQLFAVAGKESADGRLLEAFGVAMSPSVEHNRLVYTPDGSAPVRLGFTQDEWAHWLADGHTVQNGTAGSDTLHGRDTQASVLAGGAGDDVLVAGRAWEAMVGGADSDTFRFSAEQLNHDGSTDLISGFDHGDRLDLGGMRGLFADHGVRFKWSDVLSDNTLPETGRSALVWQAAERMLSYKTADSDTLHAFIRFDDELHAHQIAAAIIG